MADRGAVTIDWDRRKKTKQRKKKHRNTEKMERVESEVAVSLGCDLPFKPAIAL